MMSNERFHWSLIWKTFDLGQTFEFGNETTRSVALPTLEPPFLRIAKICRLIWVRTFKIFSNVCPRGSTFILLNAKASRGHPPWPCGRRGTFFEDFRPAGRFFSNQQIPRLCRTLAGESRTGRFRRRVVYFLEKRGSVVSTPEEGGKRHEVEYLFCEQFF